MIIAPHFAVRIRSLRKHGANQKRATTMKKPKNISTNAAPVAAPASAPAGLKKVSLAGRRSATQTPANKSAKAYPLLPGPNSQLRELVSW
jgi:hypothetical protein